VLYQHFFPSQEQLKLNQQLIELKRPEMMRQAQAFASRVLALTSVGDKAALRALPNTSRDRRVQAEVADSYLRTFQGCQPTDFLAVPPRLIAMNGSVPPAYRAPHYYMQFQSNCATGRMLITNLEFVPARVPEGFTLDTMINFIQ